MTSKNRDFFTNSVTQSVHCPGCNSADWETDMVHLGPVEVVLLHDTITIGWDHEQKIPVASHALSHDAHRPTFRRGSQVRIHCWCEQGHLFDLVLQFHKGATYWATEIVECSDEDLDNFRELWRD